MKRLTNFFERNKVKISAFALATTLLGASASGNCMKNRPIKISQGIYHSACFQNKGFPKMECYTFDEPQNTNSLYGCDYVDLSINKKNLELVTFLKIDPKTCNLSELYLMPNINEVWIINYQYLTDNDKKIINNLPNLKVVKLAINEKTITSNDKIDISWLDEGKDIYLNLERIHFDDDLSDLYLYRTLKKMSIPDRKRLKIDIFEDERIQNLKRWDSILEKTVESFNFDDSTSDEDKIIKIVAYVTDLLEYNPEVAEKTHMATDYYTDEVIEEYNKKLLESTLDGDGYAICCNYAALTSMLGFYSDVNINYVYGTCGDSINNGHAWCSYNLNGEESIIDPTFLDNSLIYNIQKSNYKTTNEYANDEKDNRYRNYMIDVLFRTSDEFFYDKYFSVGVYDFNNNKVKDSYYSSSNNIKYINELADRYYKEVMLKKAMMYWAMSFISILLLKVGVDISSESLNLEYDVISKLKIKKRCC